MRDLTERQCRILAFICTFIEDKGFPPTLREVGTQFSIRSTNGVNDHLKALERKGYLSRDRRMSRSLVPAAIAWEAMEAMGVGEGLKGRAFAGKSAMSLPLNEAYPRAEGREDGLYSVPLLGRVIAGVPIEAVENIEGTVRLDTVLMSKGDAPHFALRIVGDSMIGDGIYPGDLAFVKRCPTADSGDVVVVKIGEEATLKRFFHEGSRIRLQPSNPTMRPILIHRDQSDQVSIIGKVVGLYRQF